MALVDCLRTSKLLPADGPSELVFGENLLPALRLAWQERARVNHHAGRRRAATRRVEVLDAWEKSGACLRTGFGVPRRDAALQQLDDGPRLFWWPQGQPRQRRLRLHGVLCSRWGRSRARLSSTIRKVHRILRRVNSPGDLLVAVKQAAGTELSQQCATRLAIPLLRFEKTESWSTFGRYILERSPRGSESESAGMDGVMISPHLDSPRTKHPLPWADRFLTAVCDRYILGSVRPGGMVARTLALASAHGRTISICRDRSEGLQDDVGIASSLPDRPLAARRIEPVSRLPNAGDFLIHWTRGCVGAWPNQSQDDYWSDQISGGARADRGPLATLHNILRCKRIIGGSRTSRGQGRVVSFTAVPLDQFPARRTFRPHRGRWDFELYGIGLRRSRLVERGAAPVSYHPSASGGLFNQPCRDRSGNIDWTVEREWRILGDVDLRDISNDDCFWFTPTKSEAEHLAIANPWTVFFFEESDS